MVRHESDASPPRNNSPQSIRRTPMLLAAASAALVVGLVIVGIVAVAARRQFQPHTSDKELGDFFRQNRKVMTQFAELSLNNPEIAHMWRGHLDLKDGRKFNFADYSNPSWVELDSLMNRLPLVRGTLVCKKRVFMYNLCRGMLPGSCKGYLFSREVPAPLLESLDDSPPRLDDYKRAYKRIDDNWYIVYEVFRGARNSDTGCLGTFEAPIPNKYELGGVQP